MGLNDTLVELGDGLGYFLEAIDTPLGNLILLLAVVGGIVAIFLGIATVIVRAVRSGTRR